MDDDLRRIETDMMAEIENGNPEIKIEDLPTADEADRGPSITGSDEPEPFDPYKDAE